MMQCNLCGSTMESGLAPWHAWCRCCHLERSTLSPDINGINIMDESERETALHALRTQNFSTLLAWLARECPPASSRRMLEVGCAHGWFMEQARTRYHVQGIEPDTAIAALAVAKGLDVRQGFFPNALTEDEVFDVIVFNDVLEHIPDVRTVLAHCHAHLTTGGHVVINAPDSRGCFYRASKWLARFGRFQSFERMWQVGLPSPHLYYFDTRSVARLAEVSGFTLENSMALPAILTQGLAQRIHYAGGISKFKARLLSGCITVSMPLIKVLSPDIRVWLLKKRPDATGAARGSEKNGPKDAVCPVSV